MGIDSKYREDERKVVGHDGLDDTDMNSVQVKSGSVEVVSHFTYLGSSTSREGVITVELDHRIAEAARVLAV